MLKIATRISPTRANRSDATSHCGANPYKRTPAPVIAPIVPPESRPGGYRRAIDPVRTRMRPTDTPTTKEAMAANGIESRSSLLA